MFNQQLLDEYYDQIVFFNKEDFSNILQDTIRQKEKLEGRLQYVAAEWLFPHFEKLQEQSIAELSDEEKAKKKITKKDFLKLLRVADGDNNLFNHLLESIVNTKDPINATIGIMVAEKINNNKENLYQDVVRMSNLFSDYFKGKGLSTKQEDIEQYYKDTFMRKIELVEQERNPLTGAYVKDADGKPVFKKIERWAIHTEYNEHLIDEELKEFIKDNPKPIYTFEGFEKYAEDKKQWDELMKNKREELLLKHKNPAFANLIKNDVLFRMIHDVYQDSNNGFGEVRLKYGIIPQAFKQKTYIDKLKDTIKKVKNYIFRIKNNKNLNAYDKITGTTKAASKYIFDTEKRINREEQDNTESTYRSIKTQFLTPLDEQYLDFDIAKTIISFKEEALRYKTLRDIQSNIENLKTLINGSYNLGIEPRKAKILDINGGVSFYKTLGSLRKKEGYETLLNKQLNAFIDDVFYGINKEEASISLYSSPYYKTNIEEAKKMEKEDSSVEEILKKTSFYRDEDGSWQSDKYINVGFDLNKISQNAALYTSVNSLAFNLTSTFKNLSIGNFTNLSEGYGGRYYKLNNWVSANGEYFKNFAQNTESFITGKKNKLNQLIVQYQAVQGEYRDRYNKLVTSGGAVNRLLSKDSLFFFQHVAEHQIQGTAMIALMKATPVMVGTEQSNLWDAYQDDKTGLTTLKAEAVWSDEDDAKFIRRLHEMNRQNNGNFSALHKTVLQRRWYGHLLMVFRKHLYPQFKIRFGKQQIDYSKGYQTEGYHRVFFKKIKEDLLEYGFNIKEYDILKLNKKDNTDWTGGEIYGFRRSMFETVMGMIGMMVATMLLGGGGDDDDEDTFAKNHLLVLANSLYSDIGITNPLGIYNPVVNKSETIQQVKNIWQNPTAIGYTYGTLYKFLDQVTSHPYETYKQGGFGYKKGDNKAHHSLVKLIPIIRQVESFQHPENYLAFQTLTKKGIK